MVYITGRDLLHIAIRVMPDKRKLSFSHLNYLKKVGLFSSTKRPKGSCRNEKIYTLKDAIILVMLMRLKDCGLDMWVMQKHAKKIKRLSFEDLALCEVTVKVDRDTHIVFSPVAITEEVLKAAAEMGITE